MPPICLAPVSERYLSFAEREEIAIAHAQGAGVRAIARRLGRSPSTISRELRRNASTRSYAVPYRATTAHWHAQRRASRPKVSKLAGNDTLRAYVQDRLAGQIARLDGELVAGPDVRFAGRRHGRRADRRWAKSWSPEQISHRLRVDFPDDESMRISHEAIYQALYIQGRGALKRELVTCLRTGRALRVPRARTRQRGKKFVTDEVMISQRPPEAEDRAVPGHWEGDLIIGLDRSAIGTLVERSTRFTMLLHLPPMAGHGQQPRVHNGPPLAGHGAQAVRDAIAASITTLPQQLRRSLTWDQGAAQSTTRNQTRSQNHYTAPARPPCRAGAHARTRTTSKTTPQSTAPPPRRAAPPPPSPTAAAAHRRCSTRPPASTPPKTAPCDPRLSPPTRPDAPCHRSTPPNPASTSPCPPTTTPHQPPKTHHRTPPRSHRSHQLRSSQEVPPLVARTTVVTNGILPRQEAFLVDAPTPEASPHRWIQAKRPSG